MAAKRPRILIVDDSRDSVDELCELLRPYPYHLDTAMDGEEALDKVRRDPPDLVLLDLIMPRLSGFELCRMIKQNLATQFIPVVVVTDLKEFDDKLKAIELGADDFLVTPINRVELSTRVKSLLRVKFMHDDLDTSESILFSLAEALEAKDFYTRGHSERVAALAVSIAKRLGLGDGECDDIRKGGLLHDIGKIGIKESILLKPERLTCEEMDHVRSHPARGHDICAPLKSIESSHTIIRSHHERFDGQGYPDGLAGSDIPINARITAVADAFDAMTTDRPYRRGRSADSALRTFSDEIESGQWDPRVVRVLLDIKGFCG